VAGDYETVSGCVAGALAVCVAMGAPMGMCRAEVALLGDGDMLCDVVIPPAWATAEWQEFAAHIVAGEVRGVPAARMAVACTLVRDVEVQRPFDYAQGDGGLRERWFGWAEPGDGDREAVALALSGGCEDVPRYRYVGSLRDARYWRSIGMIGDGPFVLFLGEGGQVVVAVE